MPESGGPAIGIEPSELSDHAKNDIPSISAMPQDYQVKGKGRAEPPEPSPDENGMSSPRRGSSHCGTPIPGNLANLRFRIDDRVWGSEWYQDRATQDEDADDEEEQDELTSVCSNGRLSISRDNSAHDDDGNDDDGMDQESAGLVDDDDERAMSW